MESIHDCMGGVVCVLMYECAASRLRWQCYNRDFNICEFKIYLWFNIVCLRYMWLKYIDLDLWFNCLDIHLLHTSSARQFRFYHIFKKRHFRCSQWVWGTSRCLIRYFPLSACYSRCCGRGAYAGYCYQNCDYVLRRSEPQVHLPDCWRNRMWQFISIIIK